MATFISSPDQSGRSVTPGERRVYQRLKSHLEDDYLCWYDVPIGDRRRYPDFVLLHPRRGILILEVKDWPMNSIRSVDKLRVELDQAGRPKKVDNPLQQARACAIEVVETLAHDPQLQQTSEPFRGRLCFPWGYGAVLTAITRKQLNEALSVEDQELVLPPGLVICKDEMTESVDPEAFQERLWAMFPYFFGGVLTLPQIDRIRWHLFPEIRINDVQSELFEKGATPEEGAGESAQSLPEVMRVMDLEQERLARNLGGGHRVIHGVAGSGKTLILGYRGMHLAEAMRLPILVLCYNVTLAARLRAFFSERGLTPKVHVHHFHEWCAEQLKTYHVDTIAGDEKIWVRQVNSVIQGVAAGWIPRAQYGAVMIDEGHDFEEDWLRLIPQMVDPATDSLLLLYDDAQSIYHRSAELKFSLSSVGIKAKGRTTVLKLNYRNTREILEFAYQVTRAFISPRDADEDHVPLLAPESAGASGNTPGFRTLDSFADEVKTVVERLSKWRDEGEELNEMAVVCMTRDQGSQIAVQLRDRGIPCLFMGSKQEKRAYDPRASRISVVTAHSSKGLEFNRVMVAGVGSLGRKGAGRVIEDAKLLYVAMTRARETLEVIASGRNCYTERLRTVVG